MKFELWKMKRLSTSDGTALWHLQVDFSNGHYVTACGLRYGEAGSASRNNMPINACMKCFTYLHKRS